MAERTKKIPMRMCVVCRTVGEKRGMLRIVKTPEGEIKLDRTGKASGRGAYICGSAECLKKMRRQKILNKIFSCVVDDAVYDGIEKEFNEK